MLGSRLSCLGFVLDETDVKPTSCGFLKDVQRTEVTCYDSVNILDEQGLISK